MANDHHDASQHPVSKSRGETADFYGERPNGAGLYDEVSTLHEKRTIPVETSD